MINSTKLWEAALHNIDQKGTGRRDMVQTNKQKQNKIDDHVIF